MSTGQDDEETWRAFEKEHLKNAAYTDPSAKQGAKTPSSRAGRGTERRLVTKVAVSVLAFGSLLAVLALVGLNGEFNGDGPRPPKPHGGGSMPPGVPGGPQVDAISPDAPFRGSPAESYADGIAGITLPAANVVEGFTANQVGGRLRTVKGFLAAANLDPGVLRGDRPNTVLGLLDPSTRADLERMLRQSSEKDDPTLLLTRFDPKQAVVHGDTVKVHGRMSYQAVRSGHLRVHADYLFVYAVRPAGSVPVVIRRVLVRRTFNVDFYDPARFQATDKPYLQAYERTIAGAGCGSHQGFISPDFADLGGSSEQPTGPPMDPYDLDAVQPKECGTASRT